MKSLVTRSNDVNTHTNRIFVLPCVGLLLAFAASTASAVSYSVDWMQMTPTPFGSPPPYTGTYSLPGVGAVTMSYTGPLSDFTESRFQNPALVSGSISYGSDSYAWSNNELLARTNWAYSGVLNSPWQVTYTFSGTIPAGQLILGVSGLGRRDPNTGENPLDCITTASVSQSGTFLGDWINGNNWGPTLFSGGAGSFSMENSLTGPVGYDPWWNTGLALVRIDDPVSSLTVYFNQTAGDGIGVNLGVLRPRAEHARAARLRARRSALLRLVQLAVLVQECDSFVGQIERALREGVLFQKETLG